MPCQQVESEKSIVPNRLRKLWTLSVCLSLTSLLGCGQKPVDDIEAANKAGKAIFVKGQEQGFKFQDQLEFNGQTWVRSSEMHTSSIGVVRWYYLGSDPNTRLCYAQWPRGHELKEVFSIECRDNDRSAWTFCEKQKIVRWDGVWHEHTADENQYGMFDGPYFYSYENGVLKFSGYELDFMKVGPAEGYYPDGTLWWKGEYDDDSPLFDEMRFWGPDGNEMKDLKQDEKLEQYDRWREMQSDPQVN